MEQYFDVETGKKVEKPVVEKLKRGHDDYVEATYARHGPGKSVEVLASQAIKVARQNYYSFLAIAIESLNTDDNYTVTHSWEICGLLKAKFHIPPTKQKYVPHIDELFKKYAAPCDDCSFPWCTRVCARCGEHVCRACWSFAHHTICIEEPEQAEPPRKKQRKEPRKK